MLGRRRDEAVIAEVMAYHNRHPNRARIMHIRTPDGGLPTSLVIELNESQQA